MLVILPTAESTQPGSSNPDLTITVAVNSSKAARLKHAFSLNKELDLI